MATATLDTNARPSQAPPDLISEALADEVIELLVEAGMEIFNADGPGNPAARKSVASLKRRRGHG